MSDFNPWADAESMLRWQISLARKSIAERRKRLSEAGEIYPLPKTKRGSKPHGLPDQWVFGDLMPHQIGLSDAMGGLQWAEHKVEKAEAALSEGKLPEAIHWIIAANQSMDSALALWHSAGAIAMWRYVGKNRKAQAVKALMKRTTVEGDDGKFSMAELAHELAKKMDYLGELSPKQLWGELIGWLMEKGVEPEEKTDEKGSLLVEYTSWDRGKRKSYKYSSFKTTVSKARSKS